MPRRLSLASVVRFFRPRWSVSSTGQSSHILIRCSTRRSTIRRATDFRRSACGILPKKSARSASTTSGWPRNSSPSTLTTACWAFLPGRYAYCSGGRSASKIGSSTSIAAVMQTRSRTVEMPSGLSLPLAFGMNTRLIGSGRYVSSLSASASSASHRSTPYASMSAKSRPPPVRPCWSGTGHRHVPGCLHGSSCRTRHRSDSQLLPSLSRVTPSAASEHVSELLGCPISRSLTACCVCLELRPLPSTGITQLQRYCGPLRHPSAPSLSLTGVRLIIPDHASGLPVLRALSLCTCCRHYPGAAAGRTPRSSRPAVSAFPGRVAGSACTSSFSRLAQRLLALRPAHSRGHQFVTRYPKASDISSPPCLLRLLPAGAVAGWGLHPLESAALSRRTPKGDVTRTREVRVSP